MNGDAGPPAAHLLAIDWGTSSLRAVLMDAAGAVLDRLASPRGILFTDGRSFADIFTDVFGPWLAARPDTIVLASGMIGSRQGWHEAPYVACPAGFADLAGAIRWIDVPPHGRLGIVPGVSVGHDAVPDVMRGEEVQIFGALPAPDATGIVVLPGTHSKWVEVTAGRIVGFRTFMTGEIYGLLRTHSILGRLMSPADETRALDPTAFEAGCTASDRAGGAILNGLFGVRTLGLFDRLSADAAPDYLSGLLIGEEIREGLSGVATRPDDIRLVGRGDLAERYGRAFARQGIRAVAADPDAAFHGLHALAMRAGLLSRTHDR